jgi:hypothetical protein
MRSSISRKSTLRVSEGGKVENFDNKIHEITKPEIPKREEKKSLDRRKKKGRFHFIVVRGVKWCFLLVHMGHTDKDLWKDIVVVCV